VVCCDEFRDILDCLGDDSPLAWYILQKNDHFFDASDSFIGTGTCCAMSITTGSTGSLRAP
jgi:hypothetical protein